MSLLELSLAASAINRTPSVPYKVDQITLTCVATRGKSISESLSGFT
jgi:hypothetical protein